MLTARGQMHTFPLPLPPRCRHANILASFFKHLSLSLSSLTLLPSPYKSVFSPLARAPAPFQRSAGRQCLCQFEVSGVIFPLQRGNTVKVGHYVLK